MDTQTDKDGAIKATLKKNSKNGYDWRAWEISKVLNYYLAVENNEQVWFSSYVLRDLRYRIVEADAELQDGNIPIWLDKTAKRIEAERAARTPDEKLADACKGVESSLRYYVGAAQKHRDRFLTEASERIPNAVAWATDTVKYAHLGVKCQYLLDLKREDRLDKIREIKAEAERTLLHNVYHDRSTSALDRAVNSILRGATQTLISLMDEHLSYYKAAGIIE
jgi:hypothetical protein